MSQQQPQQGKAVFNSLAKGLITEANPITFPNDATLEDINCDITNQGTHRRRLGINYEYNHLNIPLTSLQGAQANTASFVWQNVNSIAGLNFIVIQINETLYFFEDLEGRTLSAGKKRFTLELSQYKLNENEPLGKVAFTSGKGILFAVQAKMEPIDIRYNQEEDALEVQYIVLQERDLQGVPDGLGVDEKVNSPAGEWVQPPPIRNKRGTVMWTPRRRWDIFPQEITAEHHYNLLNQGWFIGEQKDNMTLITKYRTAMHQYPSNAQQWWVGKTTEKTDYDPKIVHMHDFGNMPAPKGRIIFDVFDKKRSEVVTSLGTKFDEVTDERPSDIKFFGSKVFFLVGNTVYYSQTLSKGDGAGNCYQEGDPTSEDTMDLLDTDGGVLPVDDMEKGISMHVINNSLIILATNGVWAITGTNVDEGFTVTSHAVRKLSTVQCISKDSIVEYEGVPYFWAHQGIFTIQREEMGGFSVVNISKDVIHRYYSQISPTRKRLVMAGFDNANQRCMWYYPSKENSTNRDTFLILDLRLKAFYTYAIATSRHHPILGGMVNMSNIRTNDLPVNIVIEEGEKELQVVDSQGSPLLLSNNIYTKDLTSTKFLCYNIGKKTGEISSFTFAEFRDRGFMDWAGWDGVGLNYVSTFTSGYCVFDAVDTMKRIESLNLFLERTENSFSHHNVENLSSIYYQVKWDWEDSSSSNLWGDVYQGYKNDKVRTKNLLSDEYSQPVLVSKHLLRGRGQAMHLKFSSEQGKDFNILGWSLIFNATQK